MRKNKFVNTALILLLIIASAACKATRFVGDNQYLLNNVRIVVDDKNIDREGLKSQLRQKENLETLGFFKFHLHLYNLSRKDKEKGFFKKIGEAPVIYDESMKVVSKRQMEQYLKNKGYYNAEIESETKFKGKRANVNYYIRANQPYRIDGIKYQIKDSNLIVDFNKSLDATLLKRGDLFDVDVLVKERARITRALNEMGYYRFAEEYIYFKIDTSEVTLTANIETVIEKAQNPETSALDVVHKKYTIDRYDIIFENAKRDSMSTSESKNDSLVAGSYTYHYNGKIPLVGSLIKRSIENKPGHLYSKSNEERTYSNLYGLRQFRFVNIQYLENKQKGDSLNAYLNGRVYLPMQLKQSYSVDIEGTNTSGFYGIAGNVNYQHKNLFKGAQIFELSLRGATERQVARINNQLDEFIVKELRAEAKVFFPGFVFPFYKSNLSLSALPQTRFSMSYNYLERPSYTQTIANATYGYQWKTSAFYSHSFNLIDLYIVRVPFLDPYWESKIQDLFIKSSYTDHVISASNYSMVFNNQNANKRGQYKYVKLNFEAAGNTLWAASQILGLKKYEVDDPDPRFFSTYYKIFDIRFAQYIKGDIEFRRSYRLSENQWLTYRTFTGIGLPYGNFNVIPIERRYFTGGSNGIRAWQVRSLGPGSYTPGVDEYPNQSADIKLEANIEYRFKMVWMLEGAVFLDGGNVWAINSKDNREGVVFKFNSFYKEFALGTGFGIRLIAPFFIIRADVGLKLRDPALDGNRWIPAVRPFKQSDLALNIAVGYPF